MAMVAQELGKDPKEFSKQEYLEWLADTVGQQVGRMHKNGWYHSYLLTHNITLDGKITDLDSVGWLKNDTENKYVTLDNVNMRNSLGYFFEKLGLRKDEIERITEIAISAYHRENPKN
ncbi:MAG: hypothetical protein Q8N88_07170 [Nanoarchaeota archaeon]|nr:hypothetical protein [Nanoarchaeota archaeon]